MNLAELRVSTTELIGPQLERLQQNALGMAVIGAVLSAIGAAIDLKGFFPSYLYAYLFWLGVTTGSLALLLLHHTVGGGWGYLIRRLLEAGSRMLLPMAVLFIPIIIGLIGFDLYEWAHPQPGDHVLQDKADYLNIPFWIARTIGYFAIWMIFAYFLNRWGAILNDRDDPEIAARLNVLGAAGILVYVLTITFAMVDWVMSLVPHWYSTIFGLLTVVTQGLSTLALMLVLVAFLLRDQPLLYQVPSGWFRDLGNLTLATVMLWAYMSFSQYVITYSGNTTEEIVWYTQRARGGWGLISLALIPLHFFLPFFILLVGSRIKRDPQRLAKVALFLIGMRFLDLFWWVTPAFRDHLSVSLADLGTPLLIGGTWLWLWAGRMKDRPAVPVHDPRVREYEAIHHG